MNLPTSKYNIYHLRTISESHAIERLTALWALSEVGLGGVIHIFNSPFAGIILGGPAAILITLIAYFAKGKPSIILKSLMIVLIVKMVVSPQAGFAAYFAVLNQGIFGAYIFTWVRSFRVTAFLVTMFAMLESATQKVFLLALMYGNPLWKSIDLFTYQIFETFGVQVSNGSMWLIAIYFSIYIIFGILFGHLSKNIIEKIENMLNDGLEIQPINDTFIAMSNYKINNKADSFRNNLFRIFITVSIIFFVLIFFVTEEENWKYAVYALLRASAFVVLWLLILSPLLMKWFKKYLEKKQNKYSQDVENVFQFMNILRKLVAIAWADSKQYEGMKRVKEFTLKTMTYTLFYQPDM